MDHTEENPILAAPAADPDREARTKQEGSKREARGKRNFPFSSAGWEMVENLPI
jgi:hypothetical protein